MADKVLLFDLDINIDAAIKDSADLRNSIKTLKEEIKALDKAEGDHSESIEELTIQMQLEQKQLRDNQKETKNVIAANKESKGSINALRAELGVVTTKWNRLSKEERENTDVGKKLSKQKLTLTNNLKKLEKATGDNRRNVGNYTSALKGLGTQLLAGAGLTAGLAGAMSGLKNIIGSTAEGQIFLAKVTGASNAIMNTFRDSIIDGWNSLIDFGKSIDSTGTLLEKLGDGFVNFYKVRGEGFLKFIGSASKILDGEFSEALTDINDGFVQMTLGIEGATEKSVELLNQLKIQAAFGAAIAESEKKLELNRSRFAIQEAKDLRRIADLRATAANKSENTAEDRKAAIQEALSLERKLSTEREKFANRELALQKAVFNAHESNIDDEIKLNELRRKADEEAATSLKKQKALLAELTTIDREVAKELKDQKVQDAKEEADRKKEQAKADLEILKDRVAKEKEFLDNEKARRITNEENELALQEQNILARLDNERVALEAQHQQEIEFAEKIGADTTLIERKFANAREAINEAEVNAKLSLAADFVSNIATIAGEGTAIGKAAAIAQTTISTYQAATGAYAALAGIPVVGPALGIAAAAAAVASGLANVKKILAVKSGLPGGDAVSGGGGISASGASASSVRPEGIAPTINQGIISRQTAGASDTGLIVSPPVLVENEVTVKQNKQLANNETAVI